MVNDASLNRISYVKKGKTNIIFIKMDINSYFQEKVKTEIDFTGIFCSLGVGKLN